MVLVWLVAVIHRKEVATLCMCTCNSVYKVVGTNLGPHFAGSIKRWSWCASGDLGRFHYISVLKHSGKETKKFNQSMHK